MRASVMKSPNNSDQYIIRHEDGLERLIWPKGKLFCYMFEGQLRTVSFDQNILEIPGVKSVVVHLTGDKWTTSPYIEDE